MAALLSYTVMLTNGTFQINDLAPDPYPPGIPAADRVQWDRSSKRLNIILDVDARVRNLEDTVGPLPMNDKNRIAATAATFCQTNSGAVCQWGRYQVMTDNRSRSSDALNVFRIECNVAPIPPLLSKAKEAQAVQRALQIQAAQTQHALQAQAAQYQQALQHMHLQLQAALAREQNLHQLLQNQQTRSVALGGLVPGPAGHQKLAQAMTATNPLLQVADPPLTDVQIIAHFLQFDQAQLAEFIA